MRKCSEEMRVLVVRKLQNGIGQRELSRYLEIPRSTIQNIWKRFLKHGAIENRKRTGRPTKLNERERRQLCLQSRRNPFMTAKEVYRDSGNISNVSISTVRRILRMSGLHGRVAAKKPLLNRRHIQRRLLWCKSYLKMNVKSWENFIFSDEARIELYSRRRLYIRRPIGQRFRPRYTLKTVKFGGPSILVWGAIKGDGTKILCKCPSTLNSKKYQDVLDSSLMGLLNENSIFMQDGAPCHRSQSTLEFLDRRHVCLLSDWPALSPDLNIIENLWSVLKNRVNKRLPQTAEQLWEITQEEWNGITINEVKKLFESIPARLKEVIRNKGYHVKY